MSKPVLYAFWKSSASYRARIALNLKQVQYIYKPVNLSKNQNYSVWYEKINPFHKVPTLVIDDHTLFQSTAIIEYLEETRASQGKRLLPESHAARCQARAIAQVVNSGIHPNRGGHFVKKLDSLGVDGARVARENIERGFKGLEAILKTTKGKYCVGDKVSIADICLFPQVEGAQRSGIKIEEFESINAIYEALKQVPEIIAAHPLKQEDAPQK